MEDGGRPSGDGLQDQPSNRPALLGDKLPGGERLVKRREELVRCVPGRQTKVNRDVLSKDTQPSSKPGQFGNLGPSPAGACLGLDGDWQFSGANLAQAFMRSMGTWRFDVKGETQREDPVRVRVPIRSAGTDRLVVVRKLGNASGAKGPNRPASGMDQPARGGMCA